ncbi:MAG: hypothetical protein AAF715_02580 [Myxococcota bacterium]
MTDTIYDDVWHWPLDRALIGDLLGEVGRADARVVVSEFGGPHPDLEPHGETFAARRFSEYAQALDRLDVAHAYHFKLVEDPGADIARPNSFLARADLNRTEAFTRFRAAACTSPRE